MNDERTAVLPAAPVANAVNAAVNDTPPPAERTIELLHCPCGEQPGLLRIEMAGKGAKVGQARGSCCGGWAVEFINNTDDHEKSLVRAAVAWNSAPRLSV